MALNLIERNFLSLLTPLDHGQVAPGGYMLFHKSWTEVFGASGMALRFSSLFVGCLSIFLFYHCLNDLLDRYNSEGKQSKGSGWYHELVKKLSSRFFLLNLGLAFFSFCQMHVWYSVEFKPYALDTFLCLLVFYWSMHWCWHQKYFWHLAIGGVFFSWLSLPVMFSLAAFGIVAMMSLMSNRNWSSIGLLTGVGILWLGSFGLQYEWILSAKVNNDFLQWQHTGFYWPLEFWKQENLRFYIDTLTGLVRNPGGILFKYLGSLVILTGMIFGFKGQRQAFWLLWLPVFLAILASAFHKYSLIQRLMLFMTPALFISLVQGIRILVQWMRGIRYLILAPAVIGLLLVLQPGLNVIHKTASPIKLMEFSPLLEEIESSLIQSEWIYIDLNARFSWWYYVHQMDLKLPGQVIIGGGLHNKAMEELSALKGKGWILTVYFDTTNHRGDYNEYKTNLKSHQLVKEVKYYGAVGLQYEF